LGKTRIKSGLRYCVRDSDGYAPGGVGIRVAQPLIPTRPDDFRAVRNEPTDRLKVEHFMFRRTDGSGREMLRGMHETFPRRPDPEAGAAKRSAHARQAAMRNHTNITTNQPNPCAARVRL